MEEKDGVVYLKRTAPEPQEPSKEGLSTTGDAWLVDELPDECYVCGSPLEDKKRLTNKCDKCIEDLDKNGIVEQHMEKDKKPLFTVNRFQAKQPRHLKELQKTCKHNNIDYMNDENMIELFCLDCGKTLFTYIK
jgi:hypothetical protein